MNLGLTAKTRRKQDDVLHLQEGAAERVDNNFNIITQDLTGMAASLDAYSVDLTKDVTGRLPLANQPTGTAGFVLTGNGASDSSYQALPAGGIPLIGGTAALGKRVCWTQYAGGGSATMGNVGIAAPTLTGGTPTTDNNGFWSSPTSGLGGAARLSWATVFTRFDLLPKMITRIRTPADITPTNFRITVGMNESLAGVNTDTPSLVNQRGIYVRYSTAVPDGGWVVQTVDGSGRTVSGTILTIAASTIYVITITTVTTTSITVDINGTSVTATANIILGVNLGPELLVSQTNGGLTTSMDIQSVYLESN